MKALADVLALVSAVFLAVPAWYLNHYAALAARVRLSHVRIADPELAARHERLTAKLEKLRDEWKPWKAVCLHIGTAAGLLATALAAAASVAEVLARTAGGP